jgi:hypothetical protein
LSGFIAKRDTVSTLRAISISVTTSTAMAG